MYIPVYTLSISTRAETLLGSSRRQGVSGTEWAYFKGASAGHEAHDDKGWIRLKKFCPLILRAERNAFPENLTVFESGILRE